jgi:hypothetical protein
MLTDGAEQDDLLGMGNGQRPKQHLIGKRKDGRVRSDAEGQRNYRHYYKQRRFAKGAKGEANVLKQEQDTPRAWI